MGEDDIVVKKLCKDCKHCFVNEVVEVCKVDSELFNPYGLTECLLFEV